MSQTLLEQVHRFLDWAAKKVQIHFSPRGDVYFEERDVWWASLGENIGSEANGKNHRFERPVIVLKKFSSDLLFTVVTTTKLKNGSWYHQLSLEGREIRAVIAQARTISSRRLIRKMGSLSPQDFASVQDAFVALIKTDPPMGIGGSSDPLARTM